MLFARRLIVVFITRAKLGKASCQLNERHRRTENLRKVLNCFLNGNKKFSFHNIFFSFKITFYVTAIENQNIW